MCVQKKPCLLQQCHAQWSPQTGRAHELRKFNKTYVQDWTGSKNSFKENIHQERASVRKVDVRRYPSRKRNGNKIDEPSVGWNSNLHKKVFCSI